MSDLADLGLLSIGMELDLSELETQLRQIESYEASTLKLKTQIDEKALQQQIKALKLDPIEVDVTLNTEDLRRQLRELDSLKSSTGNFSLTIDVRESEQAIDRLSEKLSGIQKQVSDLNGTSLKLGASLDDRTVRSQLQDIQTKNRTVRIKTETEQEVTPVVRPRADTTEVVRDLKALEQMEITPIVTPRLNPNSLEAQLAKLKPGEVKTNVRFELEKYPKVKVQFDTSEARRELEFSRYPKLSQRSVNSAVPGLDPYVEVSRNPKLKFNVDSEEIRNSINNAAGSIVTAIQELAFKQEIQRFAQPATQAFGDVGGKVFEGALLGLGDTISSKIVAGIESSLLSGSRAFLEAFKMGAGLIGKAVGAIASPITNIVKGFEQAIGLKFADKFSDGYINKLEKELNVSVEKIGSVFGQRSVNSASRTVQKASGLNNDQEFKELVDDAYGFFLDVGAADNITDAAAKRYRQNYKRSAEKVKQRAAEIEVPDLAPGTKGVVFASGGYGGEKGLASNRIAAITQEILPEQAVVPIQNKATETKDLIFNSGPIPWIGQALTNSLGRVFKGYNPDAIEGAAQAYAYRQKYGDELPISSIGYSAGGFVSTEMAEIAKELGMNMKAVSIGTPFFGQGVDLKDQHLALMGELDPLRVSEALGKNSVQPTRTTAGATHMLDKYALHPDFQEKVSQFVGGQAVPASPEAQKRIAELIPQLPENFQSPRLMKPLDSRLAQSKISVKELKLGLKALEDRQAVLIQQLEAANIELDASLEQIEANRQIAVAKANKKSRKSLETRQRREQYLANKQGQSAQPPPELTPEVSSVSEIQISEKPKVQQPEVVQKVTSLTPKKVSALIGGTEPQKEQFQKVIAQRKELLRTQLQAIDKLTGPEKAQALQRVLQVVEQEEANIERDVAQKFGRNTSAVLASYRTFLSSTGKKQGIRQQLTKQLNALSPEAQFSQGQQQAGSRLSSEAQQQLDNFSKGFNFKSPTAQPGTNPDPTDEVDGLAKVAQPRGLQGVAQRLKSFAVQRFQRRPEVSEQGNKTYELLAQETARLSGVGLKPGDIPQLKIDTGRLKSIGAKAYYDLKQNQILISKEVAALLNGNAQEVQKAQHQLADIVHELRHSLQFDSGKSSIAQVAAGQRDFNVQLRQSSSPQVQEQARRSAQVATANAKKPVSPQVQSVIERAEVDAYTFEREEAPRIVDNVAAQLRQQQVKPRFEFQPARFLRRSLGIDRLEFQPENNLPEFAANAIPNEFAQAPTARQQRRTGFNIGRIFQREVEPRIGQIPLAADLARSTIAGTVATGDAAKSLAADFKAQNGQLDPKQAIQSVTAAFKSGFGNVQQGITSGQGIEKRFGEILGKYNSLKAAFSTGFNFDKPFVNLADRLLPGLGTQLTTVFKGFIALAGLSLVTNFLGDFGKKALEATVKLDNMKTALRFALGGDAQGAAGLKFVGDEVDRLKIPLEGSVAGFTKLAAATRGSSVEGQATKDVFTGLASAATVLGLTADETQGTLLAFSQTASKGTVSLEELQQAAERIPGFFGVASRSMGVTEAQFRKLVESGSVLSQDFLPKLGQQLKTEFGEEAKSAANNAQSAIFNFQNTFLELQQSFGAGLSPVVIPVLNTLAGALKLVSEQGETFAAIIVGVSLALAGSFFGALVAPLAGIALLDLAVGGITTAFGALFKVLKMFKTEIAFTALFAGAIELFRGIADAVNTDLVKSFNSAAEAAERAAKAAKDIKGPEKKEGSPQQQEMPAVNWVDGATRGFANAKGPVPTLLKATVGLPFTLAEVANRAVNYGMTGSSDYYSYADLQRDTMEADVGRVTGGNSEMIAESRMRLAALKTGKGLGADFRSADNELQAATDAQRALQARADKDYTRKGLAIDPALQEELVAAKSRVSTAASKRADVAKPFQEDLNRVSQQIGSTKAALESLKDPKSIAALGGEKNASEQRSKLETSLKELEKFKRQTESTLGNLRVDPLLTLADGFRKLTSSIEAAKRETEQWLTKQKEISTRTQIKNFSTDINAGRTAARQQIVDDNAAKQKDLTATEQGLAQQRANYQKPETLSALSALGFTPNSSIEDISRELENTGSDDGSKGKRQALEQLKSFKELELKLPGLRTGVAEGDLKLKQQDEQDALAKLDRETANRDAAARRSDATTQVGLRKRQSTLTRQKSRFEISESDAAIAEADLGIDGAKAKAKSLDTNESNLNQQLNALRQNKNSISAEEFYKRERDYITQLSDLRLAKADAQAAVEDAVARKVEATNRKVIEGLQIANQKAEAAIQRSTTDRTIAAKQGLLGDDAATDPIVSDFADKRLSRESQKIETDDVSQRAKLAQKEIADNQKLFAEKRISRKEFEQQEIALQQKLADLNNRRVDLELARQKELRDSYKALRDQQIKSEEEAARYQQASLDRSKQLLEARLKLAKAKSDASLAVDDSRLRSIDRASELKKKISDENTDPAVKNVARQQLQQIGIDPNSTELQIAEQKAAIENEIAAKKIAAQEQEFKVAQMLLELDIQRERIAARMEKTKADRGRIEAEKGRNQAERDYNTALKGGDPKEIALAKNNLELATKDVGLAAQGQQNADETLNMVDQTAGMRREALKFEQQKTRENTAQDEFLRLQSQEMTLAESGAKDPSRATQFVGPNALDAYTAIRNAGSSLSTMQPQQGNSLQQAGNVINLPGMTTASSALTVTPSTGIGALTPAPQPDFSKANVTPGESKAQSFNQDLVSFLGSKLDQLNSNIAKLANSPRSLSFTSQDPVSDFADFQNGQAASMVRG